LAKLLPREVAAVLTLGQTGALDRDLVELAEAYLNVNLASYPERVKRKDEIADALGKLVLTRQVSRDRLASSGHDGLAVALAEASVWRTESGDCQRLIDAGLQVSRLHAAFRVLSAIITVWDKPGAGRVEKTAMSELLEHFAGLATKKSDSPLMTLVETARRRLEYY
jgi:hypothetical protein